MKIEKKVFYKKILTFKKLYEKFHTRKVLALKETKKILIRIIFLILHCKNSAVILINYFNLYIKCCKLKKYIKYIKSIQVKDNMF